MSKKADRIVTIRVPEGLPEELRQLAGVPFSTYARSLLINGRNDLRRKRSNPVPTTEESTNVN